MESKPQVIIAFTMIWIRIFPGLFFNCFPEIRNTFLKVSSAVQQKSVSIVQPDIGRIPFQPFQIIVLRGEGGVAVLFQVKTAEIQFFCRFQLFRRKQRICRFRSRLKFRRGFCVGNQDRAVCIFDGNRAA